MDMGGLALLRGQPNSATVQGNQFGFSKKTALVELLISKYTLF